MQVRMPIGDLSMRLDARYHAGNNVISIEDDSVDFKGCFPGKSWQFAQKIAVKTKEKSETFWHGPDKLAVWYRFTDILGNVDSSDEGPLLMTGWAQVSALAGVGNKHVMPTFGTADTGKAFAQIAAVEVCRDGFADNRTPKAVFLGVALGIDTFKLFKTLLKQTIQG